ncbi:hypothetical protein BCV69DRAFT_177371 [Microstroma glucosiphilum]|uniref:Uncharacterized protein n=1 Tax=Pseudomicrostroma glucosiphilum TaxID=1684307 RepID=A0A316U7N4_9BASI|nr:hypothetical protein BCV69DRAFT_177371 [Pseudomicrostroma glucosiphilum]PWN20864.1 hypothetical protein BCV69DRAFT_177371 [Pseudomicrostroma glucosiphilum]
MARTQELAARRLERVQALEEREALLEGKVRQKHGQIALSEITEGQMDLMTSTAVALRRATNPLQLTAKILANHGQDPRFAFLKSDDTSGDDDWTLENVWTRLLEGEHVTWADLVTEKTRRDHALHTGKQQEVKKQRLAGLISGVSDSRGGWVHLLTLTMDPLQYDSSGSDSDTAVPAESKAEENSSIRHTEQAGFPANEKSNSAQKTRQVDIPSDSLDACLAAAPTRPETAAVRLDGSAARKVSDRIMRAREWAAQRRKNTEQSAVTESSATTRAQGNVRDTALPVTATEASPHTEKGGRCVEPAGTDGNADANVRGREGRSDLGAQTQVSGAVAADDDVLDLNAEDAAAAASRTMDEWEGEKVCFTIG